MPEYTIPLMLTVTAADHAEAREIAKAVAQGVLGENIYAADADDFDNDGQRVFYLPAGHNES